MQVRIFTEGGGDIGLGHIARCCSLYEELAGRGVPVEFFIYGEISGISILKDKRVRNTNWISCDYLKTHIMDSDTCIVDSYLATEKLYQIIAAKAKKALYIDDNRRIEYPKGMIVRPSFYPCVGDHAYKGEGMYVDKYKDHLYLTGAKFILLRGEFSDAYKELGKSRTGEVLITMGGTDIRNLTPRIVDHLCVKHSDIKLHIVLGKDPPEPLREKKPEHVNYYSNIDAGLMKELMLQSQFAITAAGQTLYELLATGTPFIAIEVIENQKDHVRAIREHIPGMPIIAYQDRFFLEKLEAEFDTMLRLSREEDFRKLYTGLVDGRGSKRIVDALLSFEL